MANMELKAIITADDNASKTISKVGSAFTSLAKIGIAGTVAGVAALTYGLKQCVDEFAEGQKGIAQTNAVLKSTKGISGMTAESLEKMNKALSTSTMFNDDMVRTGQNMLLTFTNIGKDVFPQATETVLDMAQALGQDTASSAMQLGKALNDPIKGVTALRKVGVQLTDAQADMVEKMVKAGDVMGAQKVILQELQTEFGGSAKAAGQTFAGSLAILSQHFDNLKETIGVSIITAIQPFIARFSEWASSDEVQVKIQEISTQIGLLATKMIEWVTNVAVPWITTHWPEIKRVVQEAMDVIKWLISTIDSLNKQNLLLITAAFIALGFAVKGIPGLIAIGIAVDLGLIARIISEVQGLKRDLEGLPTWTKIRILLELFANTNLTGILATKLGNVIQNLFRASGGPVSGGSPYIVGERGPELFVPNTSGRIVPNNQITNNDNGVTVNFYGNIANTSNASLDEIANRIGRQIQLVSQGI